MSRLAFPNMRGVRYLQVFFLFSCCLLGFQHRVNVSVGLVAMTDSNNTNPDFPEYALTWHQKSFLISALFWGCTSTQLVGGYIACEYGTVKLLFVSQMGMSLTSMFLPASMAVGGWMLFSGLRVVQGLAQGLMWPGVYEHLAQWSPRDERNRLGAITQTGMDWGIGVGFALSGVLAASRLGWPSMFYVPGVVGILWSVAWLFVGTDTPQESKIITEAELSRIRTSLSIEGVVGGHHLHRSVPWHAIFTSTPYLVLLCVKVSHSFAYATLMQQVPLYMNGIFNFDIEVNALLSGLPFAFMSIMSYVTLVVADLLRKKVSLTVLRKSINTYASWVPALAFTVLSFMGKDNVVGTMACLMVVLAAYAGVAIGSSLNHIDLSPNYAGLLFGITTTVVSGVGIISPLVVDIVVKDEGDQEGWGRIFLGIAASLFFGNLLYILFGEMVVQPWNDVFPKRVSTRPKENK